MARNWLVDGRTIAKKVKNPTWSSATHELQGKESELIQECPNCYHIIKNTDEWPGLPCGVKFDPSDAELLEHLAAKCGIGNAPGHVFIDDFIPTIQLEQGICYTHPKYLPGAKKDGSSMHFFHKTVNAYATGPRKRRKIQHNLTEEDVRWHKTGKTKPVIENGMLKGWKKIMVLYKSSKKGTKQDKSNWVMHQYHLGADEEERAGEYVVSKIHKQKQNEVTNLEYAPKTPNTNTPPLLECKTSSVDYMDNTMIHLGWLAAESQVIDNTEFPSVDDLVLDGESQEGLNQIFGSCLVNKSRDAENTPCGLVELEKLDFDSPPDLLHPDLPLGSQENIYDWLY